MTSFMNRLIISILVAIVIFWVTEIDWKVYAVVLAGVWALLRVNFTVFKNHYLYKKMLWISLFVSMTFYSISSIKKQIFTPARADLLPAFIVMLILLAVLLALIMSQFNQRKNKIENESMKHHSLHPKREKDLESLETYLKTFEIVGINGKWGTGKTFLVNHLKEKVEDEYAFIEIDILTSNLDEIQLALIEGFEEILAQHQILPKYANKLRKMIKTSQITSKIAGVTHLLFDESESKSKIIQGFQNEVQKLDKKVLVIYEDMDRIVNKEAIQEIFSISEKLASERIRIIYQYDESMLVDNIGFTYNYLEKYIPYKMNLTELSFKENLQFELQLNEDTILKLEDLDFLEEQKELKVLAEYLPLNKEYSIKLGNIPFRKVKQLVYEIELAFSTKRDLYKHNRRTVISFYILKHLYPHLFERLSSQHSISEAFTFEIGDEHYSTYRLVKWKHKDSDDYSLIRKAFRQKESQDHYRVLKLFGYEVSKNFDEGIEHRNQKIDRVIWNLLYEGESPFTDIEQMVKQFTQEVIKASISTEQRFNASVNFFSNLEYQYRQEKKGQNPPKLIDVFKAFKLVNENAEHQEALVDLYFNHYNHFAEFDLEVVRYMNECPLHTRSEYLKIIHRIIELNVIGNLNRHVEFGEFLNKYIRFGEQLYHGSSYQDYREVINDSIAQDNYKIEFTNPMKEFADELKVYKLKYKNPELKSIMGEYEAFIAFIEKMIKVIRCEELAIVSKSAVIDAGLEVKANERVQELLELYKKDPKEGVKQLMKSYEAEEITLGTVDRVLEEDKKS